VAEMAMAGKVGVSLLASPDGIAAHAFWFGEDQARYVLAVEDAESVLRAAESAGVPVRKLGRAAPGGHLTLPDGVAISLETLHAAHDRFFRAWMDE